MVALMGHIMAVETHTLIFKLILIAASTILGLVLSMLASLMVENGEWSKLSARTRWGHRVVGAGIAIIVSLAFFAANPSINEQKIWALLGSVSVFSFSGMQGYKTLIKRRLGGG